MSKEEFKDPVHSNMLTIMFIMIGIMILIVVLCFLMMRLKRKWDVGYKSKKKIYVEKSGLSKKRSSDGQISLDG